MNRFSPSLHIPHYSGLFFRAIKHPLIIYIFLSSFVITLGAAALFWSFEGGVNPKVVTFFDALWWAACTTSAVGYGEIVPVTWPGRITGIFLIVTGVTLFLSFIGILTAIISGLAQEEFSNHQANQDLMTIKQELRELKKLIQDKFNS